MKRIRDIPNLKQTDRQAIEEYLSNFVRICSMHNIAEGDYCRDLAPKLPPSLSAILVRMPIDKANDFKALESAIFSQYLLDADYFRSRFYSLTQDTFESAFEYVRRLRELLEKWLSSEKVEETYAAVLDFFLENQFMRKLSTDKTVFLKERTPDTLDELCELSDVFDRAHIRRGKPSFNSSGNSGNFRFHLNGSHEKDDKSAVAHKNGGFVSRNQVQDPLFCHFCKRRGHTEDRCRDKIKNPPWPRNQSRGPQNSGPHVKSPNGARINSHLTSAIKLVNASEAIDRIFVNSNFKGDDYKTEIKQIEVGTRIASIKSLSVTDNTRGGVDNVVRGSNFTSHTEAGSRLDPCDIAYLGDDPIGYKCVRDTGSWVNVIKSSLVPDDNLTGESISNSVREWGYRKMPDCDNENKVEILHRRR